MRTAIGNPYACESCGRGTAQAPLFRVSGPGQRWRGRCGRCMRMPGQVDRSAYELHRQVAEANLR